MNSSLGGLSNDDISQTERPSLETMTGTSPLHISRSRLKAVVTTFLLVVIVVLVPWEDISNVTFVDLENYTARLLQIQKAFSGLGDIFRTDSFLSAFSSEITWLAMLQFSVYFELAPEGLFLILSLFSAALFGLYAARNFSPLLSLVLLVNPAIIDLANSQLRSVFAISLFLMSVLLTKRTKIHYFVLIFGATIHTAMIVILTFYWIAIRISSYRGSGRDKRTFLLISAFVAVISFVIVGPLLLGYIGDRRSIFGGGGKSLLFLMPWLGLLVLLIVGTSKDTDRNWTYYFSTLLLALVLAVELAGGSLFRLISMCFPIILVSLNYLKPTFFLLAVSGILVNNFLYFLLWL